MLFFFVYFSVLFLLIVVLRLWASGFACVWICGVFFFYGIVFVLLYLYSVVFWLFLGCVFWRCVVFCVRSTFFGVVWFAFDGSCAFGVVVFFVICGLVRRVLVLLVVGD